MNNFKKEYLLENDEYIERLNKGLQHLESLFKELMKFEIDIKSKPWYKNIVEIYIPEAYKFYDNCKNTDFNIENYNNKWIRKDFKSFISELEKFIIFFSKIYQNKETSESFFRETNNIKNKLIVDFKCLFEPNDDLWERDMINIHDQLHNWRNIQNKNKHEDEHLDSNYYIDKNKMSLTATGNDVLEYVSDSIWYIIKPLLSTLIVILKKNNK